jgi:predicted ATPase/DNA-binding SARP family transcriptional activator
VRFGILGPLAVWRDGDPVEIGGLRVRMVLAMLLLDAGRTVSSGRLIDEIWAESPPAGVANALQSLVSRLRTAVEPVAVELAPGGYRLAVEPEAIDARRFERLAAEGRRALADGDPHLAADRLREGLALWRGEALADLAAGGFAQAAVARLGQLRLTATEDRIEAELAIGRADDLLAEFEALVAAHPLNERLRGLQMRGLYAAGRQADALALFAATRRLLADELGVDPSPELDRLHTAMLRRDPSLGPAAAPLVGHGAPRAQLTSFVGREEEVRRVAALLRERRLVTLVGPGGTGKTRLAVELAAREPSEVRLVELAPVSDSVDVPQAVLAVLGAREVGLMERGGRATDPLERVRRALADKRLLLVLDNCEHLIDSAAQLADAALGASPELRILATSREPLGVAGESLWPVPPLGLPPADVEAAAAPSYPAMRLFLDRATAVRPDFALDHRNVEAVAQVCRRLDGMPLAIELAAARLRSLTAEQVAERLDDRFALLTGGSRTALPRHQTLRAVVDWSWDLLDEPERVLLRRLSVFVGGATLESAESACSGRGLDGPTVLDLLARLVDRSLLEAASSEPGTMRYRLLETVRAYGVERLAEAGEEEAVRRAHAEHFCVLAERADPELRGRHQLVWLARLNSEHDNLRGALRWAIDAGEAELAQRLVIALHWYWTLRGYRVEGRGWVRTAAALRGEVSVPVRAAVLMIVALLAVDEGNIVEGTAAFEASEELYRESGERPHPVFWMVGPPLYLYGYGDETRARESIAGVLADDGADPWARAGMLMIRGMIDYARGRLDEAEASLMAAASRCRELGDRFGLAAVLTQVAQVAEDRGDYAGAEAAVLEALDRLEPLDAREDVAWQWIRLGWIRGLAGDETGRRQIEEGIDRARAIGATDTVAMGLYVGAALARHRGDLPAARHGYEQALAVMETAQAGPSYFVLPTIGLGFVAELEGDVERAEAWHRRAIRMALDGSVAMWNRLLLADAAEGLAGAAAAAGRPERAATLLGAADSLRDHLRARAPQRMDRERVSAVARGRLGAEHFERARRRGEEMTHEDILAVISS